MQFQRQSNRHAGAASSGASRRPGAVVPPAVHRSVASKVAVVARPGPSSAGNMLPVDLSSPPEWGLMGIPHYLQSLNEDEFETAWQAALAKADSSKLECLKAVYTNSLWATIRAEAEQEAAEEQLLSSFLYASILAHSTFEHSLAFVLANRLCNATMLSTQLFNTFLAILQDVDDVRLGALADLEATVERDPACTKLSHALLYYKGYHALQTQRIAHVLWGRGQKVMALALQSRISEVFAVDIHPAARLGRGILLDHGTGVVIGETAVIGNNVSLLQNITLGGTGKESGDRHPKIHDNVLIGASATILGNITIGWGAQIAAGSLVLKSVPPQTMVAGSPAREIGRVEGSPAATMKQWSARNFLQEYERSLQSFATSIDGSTVDVGSIDSPTLPSSSSSGLGERRLPPSPPPALPASPTPPSAASASGAQAAVPVEQPATSQPARTVDQVLASLPLEKLEQSGNGSSRGANSNGNGASSSNGNGKSKKAKQQLPVGPPPSVLIQTHRGPPLEWIL